MLSAHRLQLWWLLAALGFGVAYLLAWGASPIAVAFWSSIAIPLGRRTLDHVGRGGRRVAPALLVGTISVWVGLLASATGLVLADAALAPYEARLQWVGLLFATWLTGWGLWSARPAGTQQSAPPAAPRA